MKRLTLLATAILALAVPPVLADTIAVDDAGNVRISGQVSGISRDSFTLTHPQSDSTSEVTFGGMSASSIDKLTETNILQDGSYVTVEGRLTTGAFNRSVIAAHNIYVQSPPAPAE